MVPTGGIYNPRSQPLYPDMELADTISVSENKYNQYKHTTTFILNIWLNKSLWPLHWRQPSSHMECVGGHDISILFARSFSI